MADTTRLSEPLRRAALDRLSAIPSVGGFSLAGGTAIAMHLGQGLTLQYWQDLEAFFRREVPPLMQTVPPV